MMLDIGCQFTAIQFLLIFVASEVAPGLRTSSFGPWLVAGLGDGIRRLRAVIF